MRIIWMRSVGKALRALLMLPIKCEYPWAHSKGRDSLQAGINGQLCETYSSASSN